MDLKAYNAAKNKAAFADVSAWGKLVFRGTDCKKFLHGLLTNDIQNLKPGQGLPTCILTPKGKLIADFTLYDIGVELISIQLPQATAGILTALSKVLILSETVVEDISTQWAAFLVVGPQTPKVLKRILNIENLEAYACTQVPWGGESLIVLSYPIFGSQATIVLIATAKANELQSSFIEQGPSYGLESMGSDVLEILRIEAGISALGVDTDSDSLPLELPLEHTISFSKGCYMGQETTARIKNFGHVNRKLVGLRLKEGVPLMAGVSFKDQSIGKITSVVESPKLGAFLAMALIHSEQSNPGTHVFVVKNGNQLDAEVIRLPLS